MAAGLHLIPAEPVEHEQDDTVGIQCGGRHPVGRVVGPLQQHRHHIAEAGAAVVGHDRCEFARRPHESFLLRATLPIRRGRRVSIVAPVKVSTRGDYACRALVSLALHGDGAGPDIGARHRGAHGPAAAVPRADPAGLEGRGPRSFEARGRGRLRARPRTCVDHARRRSCSAVDGPIVLGDFGEPHQNGACDHEGQCVLLAVWAGVSEQMRRLLDALTLSDVVSMARGERAWPAPD